MSEVAFDRNSAERIAKAVRKMERLATPLAALAGGNNPGVSRISLVQANNSTIVTDASGNSFVAGKIMSGYGDASYVAPSSPAYPPGAVVPASGKFNSTSTQDCWINVSFSAFIPLHPTPAVLNGQWQNGTSNPWFPVYTPAAISLTTLSSTFTGYTLTTSWGNSGLSLSLPANSTWLVLAQLNASLTASASGAGDSVSCRLYDGTSLYGSPVEFCNALCASITEVDAAVLTAIVAIGASAKTLAVQAIINTSTASTGTLLSSSGSLSGSILVGVRVG